MRALLLLLCLFTSLTTTTAQAEQHNKSEYTIVMLLWRGMTDAERGFMDYLNKENIKVNYIIKNCEKDKSRLPAFIAETKALKPDLIYTFGTTVTRQVVGTTDSRSANKNILSIPVVFNIVADPIGAKLTDSLKSSNSNFTGVSHTVPMTTQLNVMAKVKPLKKLAVLYNPLERNSKTTVAVLREQAVAQSFFLLEAPLTIGQDGKPAITSINNKIRQVAKQQPDFLYLPSDSFLISNAKEVINTAKKFNLASFSSTEGPIRQSGALMGIVSTYSSVGKFAGYKAKQILLQDKKPESMPIETLKQFSLLVNITTAKQINFFPPVSILSVAEVVN